MHDGDGVVWEGFDKWVWLCVMAAGWGGSAARRGLIFRAFGGLVRGRQREGAGERERREGGGGGG